MRSNRLQLRTKKTELLWRAGALRQSQLPSTPLRVGSTMASHSSSIRNPGLKPTYPVVRGVRHCLPTHIFNSLVLCQFISLSFTVKLAVCLIYDTFKICVSNINNNNNKFNISNQSSQINSSASCKLRVAYRTHAFVNISQSFIRVMISFASCSATQSVLMNFIPSPGDRHKYITKTAEA